MEVSELAAALVARLAERGMTAATAESCTGGLAAQWITSVSGASEVFEFGAVTYANRVKSRLLGVNAETLARFGAVSEQTAMEMAEGVRRVAESGLGLATTGIAGPTGGTPSKPVGTVYIAVSGERVVLREKLELGPECGFDRAAIRRAAVIRLFELALRALE